MTLLLRFQFTLPDGDRRSLEIDDDGAVRSWDPAPDPGAPAGLFALAADEQVATSARRLADSLAALPAVAAPPGLPERTVVDATVVAHADGHERAHRYGFTDRDALAPELVEADELARQLHQRAADHPVAAVQLAIEIRPPVPDRGQQGTVHFALTNPGTEPVSLTLRRDSVRAELGEHSADLSGRSVLGMTDPGGRLLDGLLVPATLAGGAVGRLVLLDALPVPQPGEHVRGGLAGMLGVPGQGADPVRFRLVVT